MAYSGSSFGTGQIPIQCQLCETSSTIVCKCIECKLFMCRACRTKVHIKFQNAAKHRVLDIKDLGSEEQEIDFSGLMCEEHNSNCCLFCKTCDSLVCPTCVSKTHQKHELIEILEGYKTKIKKLRNEKSCNEKTNHEIFTKIKELKKYKVNLQSRLLKEEQEIENHGEALKREIDKHVARLKQELRTSGKSVIQAYDTDLKELENNKKQSDNKNKELEELIHNTNAEIFFNKANYKYPFVSIHVPRTPSEKLPAPRYVPGETTQTHIGKLVFDEGTTESLRTSLQVKNKVKTDLSYVNRIIQCDDESVWISCFDDKALQHIKHVNGETTILTSITTQVFDMTITTENNILLCIPGKTRLQQLNSTTGHMTDTLYDVAPLRPASVHMTSQGKVVVGAGGKERWEVIIMDSKGKQQQIYKHYNKQLFTCLSNITSTSNGNLHVVDFNHKTEESGRVVVLGQEGDTRNVYTGHPDVNRDIPFRPWSIVTNQIDNTIVTDAKTRHLHILNNDGQLLSVCDTRDVGIELPFSLTYTPNGSLWIGCATYKESNEKAKLYLVNLSRC